MFSIHCSPGVALISVKTALKSSLSLAEACKVNLALTLEITSSKVSFQEWNNVYSNSDYDENFMSFTRYDFSYDCYSGVHMFWCAYVLMCIRSGVHMFWCAYVLVCIRFGVHTFWCAYVLVWIRSVVHMFWCAYVLVCICSGVHTFWCAYVLVCICSGVHTFCCAYVLVCICSGVHMYNCLYAAQFFLIKFFCKYGQTVFKIFNIAGALH